ncbi:MAG: acyl transferase [Aureispira sp.]|nr:acyl transferase [Aureispira sp.]
MRNQIIQKYSQLNNQNFEAIALEVFQYQAQNNPLYQKFLKLLGISIMDITSLQQIPFLPISFFKNHLIKTADWPTQTIFSSSGTTGQTTSQHHVRDLEAYTQNALKGFQQFYGNIQDYVVLALLPSYLERQGSSLVYMAEQFIQHSHYKQSGFFLYNTQDLLKVLGECTKKNWPTLLLGVTYALLDLAAEHPTDLKNTIIMETGGMKGRRKELPKFEIHRQLKTAFQVKNIHSEYGMTELLSQAYSKGEGVFYPSATMRILLRDITDPLHILPTGKTGVINIIDLANIDSCSFIATDDLGRLRPDGGFEVLGRLDLSDLRGCNLLLS